MLLFVYIHKMSNNWQLFVLRKKISICNILKAIISLIPPLFSSLPNVTSLNKLFILIFLYKCLIYKLKKNNTNCTFCSPILILYCLQISGKQAGGSISYFKYCAWVNNRRYYNTTCSRVSRTSNEEFAVTKLNK